MAKYYDNWHEEIYRCTCGWTGLGKECPTGETFAQLYEIDCPQCHEHVDVIEYPTFAECRDNWDKVSEIDKRVVEIGERQQALYKEHSLKSPNDLPDLAGEKLFFEWDYNENLAPLEQAILCNGKLLWKEPGGYENFDRFIEIAKIIRAKYGARAHDLIPTERSKMNLYGDRMSSPDIVKKARHEIFGLT
ncbi:MAG: hypothetical protein Q7T03_05635 [Deltaproteobacteria bacterium]|nr:hypothetical protein [Deltaproteobacteria bacterium]